MNSTSVVYVVYGVDTIDLDWIPAGVPVLLVHNDHTLDRAAIHRDGLVHLGDGTNVGFGAAVNRALDLVDTDRVILCNPDTKLGPHHFDALVDASPTEIVTIPLVEEDGTSNSVINKYWNVVALVATARRLGRFAPRGTSARQLAGRFLGGWGRGHLASFQRAPGTWPLAEWWAPGAVLSLSADLLREVGGFDEDYFLYYEDADVQQRLSRHVPGMTLRLADVVPGLHVVGGCDTGSSPVEQHRRVAARVYASRQKGWRWRAGEALIGSPTRLGGRP